MLDAGKMRFKAQPIGFDIRIERVWRSITLSPPLSARPLVDWIEVLPHATCAILLVYLVNAIGQSDVSLPHVVNEVLVSLLLAVSWKTLRWRSSGLRPNRPAVRLNSWIA